MTKHILVAVLVVLMSSSPAHAGVIGGIKKAGKATGSFVVRQVKKLPEQVASAITGAVIAIKVVPLVVPFLI